MTNKHFDVIIVGSGMGALTSASLFAQLFNKRVLVLRRDLQFGGDQAGIPDFARRRIERTEEIKYGR